MKGPRLPWKTRLLVMAINPLSNAAVSPRCGAAIRRLLPLFDRKTAANSVPIAGVSTGDHHVDPTRGLWVRIFTPLPKTSGRSLPIVVYFHGGGFTFMSAASRTYDALCRRIGGGILAVVVSVEYRRSPENRFPAAYDDGEAVLRWLEGDVGGGILLSDDSSMVFLAGDSAGGNIVHHLARRMTEKPLRMARIAGLVAIQPFFGGEVDTESEARLKGALLASRKMFKWMWRSFLPVGSDLDHEAANLFGPNLVAGSHRSEWTEFPKVMVCIAGWDPLQDRQRQYCEGLREAGVDVCISGYPNGFHGFLLFSELPEAEQIITDIRDFVINQLDKDAPSPLC